MTILEDDGFETLYDDDYCTIIGDSATRSTTLILKGRLSLAFEQDEWDEFRMMVMGIKIPDDAIPEGGSYFLLYEGKHDLVVFDGKLVKWSNGVRMITLDWHMVEWEKFQKMIATVE